MEIRRGFFLTVGVAFFASLLMVMPASAANDELEAQIKALEQQVSKIEELKDQIDGLKSQQIELKKDATAAAAALPSFEYRPGRGLTIAAADKSWSFNMTYRLNMYMYNILRGKPNFSQGGDQINTGATNGEIFPRRNRLYFSYCWSDCFIQADVTFDGETAPRQTSWRDSELMFHFDQWNEYLPYFSVGLRRGAGRTHISRSSDNDGKVEHSIILDGFAWGGDGSHAGAGIGWEEVDIGPSKVEAYFNWASSRQGTHQEFVNDDRKGLLAFVGARPFANIKNKWIEGLDMGVGFQWNSQNSPFNMQGADGVSEIRVRNTERRGRFEFFRPAVNLCPPPPDAEACDQNFGGGYSWVIIPGLKYQVGPYMFRAVWLTTQYRGREDTLRGIEASGWTIDHQVFLWSPKGFFTGSQTTPNSIMFSFGFERGDMECGRGCDASPSTGSFHRNTVLNREAALWYWVRPSFGIGTWMHYWTSANTPVRTQVGTGCKENITEATSGKGAGRSCSFSSANVGIRYRW
jgi:hypothetical protein